MEEGVEGFDLIEEKTIVHHVLVVGRQLGQGAVFRNEPKHTSPTAQFAGPLNLKSMDCSAAYRSGPLKSSINAFHRSWRSHYKIQTLTEPKQC